MENGFQPHGTVAAWRTNPYAVLAWCAVAWGAGGFFIDGILTALVGDDTTWTHAFAFQALLQFPFMLGILVFGALGAFRWRSVKSRADAGRATASRT